MGNTIAFQVPLWTKQRNNLFVSSKICLAQSPTYETSLSFPCCEKSPLQILPPLEFCFHKTVSLINSHAGSGRAAFVLRSMDLPPLLIMEIQKITDFLPAYSQRNSITWAERALWRLCQLLERILHWVTGQTQNIPYTSMGNLPKHIPSAHFIQER